MSDEIKALHAAVRQRLSPFLEDDVVDPIRRAYHLSDSPEIVLAVILAVFTKPPTATELEQWVARH